MIRTYRLPQRWVRVDSTTAKIDKQVAHGSFVMDIPKIIARIYPVQGSARRAQSFGGHRADVAAGNAADDLLYLPMIDRPCADWQTEGLVFLGDCKLSSLANRAHIQQRKHFYLAPLAQVSKSPNH